MQNKTLLNSTLALADDGLILGHRLSEWCGKTHSHEEDLALANIGLDLIGQSRSLYAYASELDGKKTEDDFAYQRDEQEFRNLLIAELPNGDFAFTIARLFLYAAFMSLYWRALQQSRDAALAAVADRAIKENAYHLKHAADWVIRLGQGTSESTSRLQQAFTRLASWTDEMFAMDEAENALASTGVLPNRTALRAPYHALVAPVCSQAGIDMPSTHYAQSGGRQGRHTEHLGYLLAEMQVLARRHPQAVW